MIIGKNHKTINNVFIFGILYAPFIKFITLKANIATGV